MSSINTNVAAMTALQTLTPTNKELTEVQSRISMGYRVAEASDNAAYWSIATTMRSDNAALSTVQDALGLGAATVDVAYTGINSAINVVDQIKSKLVAARQPGVDRNKVQSEITELQCSDSEGQMFHHASSPLHCAGSVNCRRTAGMSIGVQSGPTRGTPAPSLPALRCAARLQVLAPRRHNLRGGQLFEADWSAPPRADRVRLRI
jgi:hypothetical protein